MDNDNDRQFLVKDLNGQNARVINAHGFEIEEASHATIFYDVEDKLVARLFNVSVEPVDNSRESSDEMVKLAQKYIDFESDSYPAALVDDIRSLAGSVLSQAKADK